MPCFEIDKLHFCLLLTVFINVIVFFSLFLVLEISDFSDYSKLVSMSYTYGYVL